ncbi:MAG: ParA family protein [Planctomycetota bacterium]|jgi:chromosome partitioning protein|nr:ParA family protein [Planctomycetota bacterium]
MKIVAFMNQKGGVGKTTSVVNIGAILAAEYGYKVLLIDLDPQGHLSEHLGVYPEDRSIYDVLVNNLPAAEAVRAAFGMDILPANLDLSAAEVELVGMMSRELRLKKTVGEWAKNYDYVLIDCQPSLGLLPICGLSFAEHVIVPMEAEYLALKGLSQLVNTIRLIGENLNPALTLSGVLFCMYSGNSTLAKSVKADVENSLPAQVFASVARRNVRLAEAPSHGKPIINYDAPGGGAADYRQITAEFLQRLPLDGELPRAGKIFAAAVAAGDSGKKKKRGKSASREAATANNPASGGEKKIEKKAPAKAARDKPAKNESERPASAETVIITPVIIWRVPAAEPQVPAPRAPRWIEEEFRVRSLEFSEGVIFQ